MRDTIDMAREANLPACHLTHEKALKRFADLVRADEREETNRRANASWTLMCEKMITAEREACAKVCERLTPEWPDQPGIAQAERTTMLDCAAAIRARGQA
jgi:hypothetical protein